MSLFVLATQSLKTVGDLLVPQGPCGFFHNLTILVLETTILGCHRNACWRLTCGPDGDERETRFL